MIVEYKLHRNNSGQKTVPTFIEDGGYFNVGDKMVGVTAKDGSYVPSGLVVLTEADLILRLTSMKPLNVDGEPLTEGEIALQITNFMAKDES